MTRHIEVVPHNPHWSEQFEQEVDELTAVFGEEIVAAHHIGSTAIPGIVAKPIIDILLEVRDIGRIDAFNEEMRARGYLPKGAFGIPGRRFFIKGTEESRTHHIHVFQAGDPEFRRHLTFRDYLRAHRDEAQAYSRLKQELAQRVPHDIEGYMAGKDAFIKEIERRAEAWNSTRDRTGHR
ncbi:MAG: GrpB family protein [Anaerolineae bacterium]|nr:GrpB family protein [Anaerolineae bacterium]